jgi:hypothetical protein
MAMAHIDPVAFLEHHGLLKKYALFWLNDRPYTDVDGWMDGEEGKRPFIRQLGPARVAAGPVAVADSQFPIPLLPLLLM